MQGYKGFFVCRFHQWWYEPHSQKRFFLDVAYMGSELSADVVDLATRVEVLHGGGGR